MNNSYFFETSRDTGELLSQSVSESVIYYFILHIKLSYTYFCEDDLYAPKTARSQKVFHFADVI